VSDLLLAVDTATAWCGIGLYDGALQLELNWRAERHHSEQLMPGIERALDLLGVDRTDLAALGVSRGPGSYTGVRVGITVARMLAYALDIPIVGVDALDVLAHPHVDRGKPIRSFLDAGRRRYATALYRPTSGGFERVGTLQSVGDDSMVGLVSEPTICCGELSSIAQETLKRDSDEQAIFPSPASTIRRAAVLAELAWLRWQAGDPAAAVTDPIYVTGAQS
jgi:tRNA threonylcarbamoyl adenosine modification protein YeaZ